MEGKAWVVNKLPFIKEIQEHHACLSISMEEGSIFDMARGQTGSKQREFFYISLKAILNAQVARIPTEKFTDQSDVSPQAYNAAQLRWIDHCRHKSDTWRAIDRSGAFWCPKIPGLHVETQVIFDHLTELTRLGFYTMSSQPTAQQTCFADHVRQRAYVAGYLPRALVGEVLFLISLTTRGFYVGLQPDRVTVTDDQDESILPNWNWGGSMCEEALACEGLDQFPELDLVPLELIDLDWDRKDARLFDTLIAILDNPVGYLDTFEKLTAQQQQHH